MILFIKTVWLLLPAGLANMAPVFAARIFPHWNTPIDFGETCNGKQIFGAHKTYRGLMCGALMGCLVFILQRLLFQSFDFFKSLSFFNYEDFNLFFGARMGLAALLGDLFKSFFKRQIGIAPGQPWVPFDQLDWIIGALLSISLVIPLAPEVVVSCLFIGLVLHLVVRYIGYFLSLNSTPI
jgi:CDP-2,3-bis-(O-geranylgeranyl)-sn-glycerol synthase